MRVIEIVLVIWNVAITGAVFIRMWKKEFKPRNISGLLTHGFVVYRNGKEYSVLKNRELFPDTYEIIVVGD